MVDLPSCLLDPIKTQPLKDLSRAVCQVRKLCEKHHVNENQIAVVGFSAGGHLTASLGVHYDKEEIKAECDRGVSNRPDAIVLAYPVITAREHAHVSSIKALYGEQPSESELQFASIEENVKSDTPPTFLWHTMNDFVVPVENSLLYANACKKNNVPLEMHVYSKGRHGLSMATKEWEDYTNSNGRYEQ